VGLPLPYLITGSLNQHPRAAMAWMDSERWNDFVGFYDSLAQAEDLE